MKTGLLFDELYQKHDTGRGHPERPERLVAISKALQADGRVAAAERVAMRDVTTDELMETGARLFALKRAYDLRCGIRSPDDTLPEAGVRVIYTF